MNPKFKKRREIYLSSLTKMLMVSLEPGGNGKGKVGNGGGGGGGNSVCRAAPCGRAALSTASLKISSSGWSSAFL